METISKRELFRLYLRSFFVQAGWNYERMIALGFTWILLPVMEKLGLAEEQKKNFLRRHLSTFNSNPYLATYAVGAVAKLEETGASEEEIVKFKNSLRGPLGALGDNLIWMNLRPALLILGMILASTSSAMGALAFWFLYNINQLYLRARGLSKGYDLGLEVSSDLKSAYYKKMIKWISRMGAVLLAIFFVLMLSRILPGKAGNSIILMLSVFLSIFGFRNNFNPGYVLLICFLLFLLAKWIGVLI